MYVCKYPREQSGDILHPYLPVMATSLQQPLSSVPKMVVVERLYCNSIK